MTDPEVEGWKAEVQRLRLENEAQRKEIERLRGTPRAISGREPATTEITLAHTMAQEAREALSNGERR
jgi:hypothetical protein